jgi:hypothetical protein
MGDVILFSQRRKPALPARAAEFATAEIMFFTGVRYQRMSESAPTPTSDDRPSSQGGKRKRKRG